MYASLKLKKNYIKLKHFHFRVGKEETRQNNIISKEGEINNTTSNYTNSSYAGSIRDESNEDRLIDIYIFTGITIATIVITLSRSFLFFNVIINNCIQYYENNNFFFFFL